MINQNESKILAKKRERNCISKMDRFDVFLQTISSAQDSAAKCRCYDEFLKICKKDLDTQIDSEMNSQISASSVEPTKLSKLVRYIRDDLPKGKCIQLRCRSTSMLSWLFSYNFLKYPVDSNTLDTDEETRTIIYLLIANLKETVNAFIDDPSNSNNNHLLDGTLFLLANQCIPTQIKVHYTDIILLLCKGLLSFDEVSRKCSDMNHIFGTYLLFIRVLAHINITQQIVVNNKQDINIKVYETMIQIYTHYFNSELSDPNKYIADIVTINQFIIDLSNLLRLASCDEVKLLEFAKLLGDAMYSIQKSLDDKTCATKECVVYTSKLKQIIIILSALLRTEALYTWFMELIIKDNKVAVLTELLYSLFKIYYKDKAANIDMFKLLKSVINAYTLVPDYYDKKSIIRIFFKFCGPFLHENEIIKYNRAPSTTDKLLELKRDPSIAREAYGCIITLFSKSWPYGFLILNTAEKKVNGTKDGGLKVSVIVDILINALNGDTMLQMISNEVISRDYVYEIIINSSKLLITMLNTVNTKDSTICSYSSTVTNQELDSNNLDNMLEIAQHYDAGLFAPTNVDNAITFDSSIIVVKIEEIIQYLKWLSVCFRSCSEMYDAVLLDDNQRFTVKEILKRLVYSWQIAINAIGTYFVYYNTNISTQYTQTQTSQTIFTCDGEGNKDEVVTTTKNEQTMTFKYIQSTIEELVADCWSNCWVKALGKSIDKSRGLFIESIWWILRKFSAFKTRLKHEKSYSIIRSEVPNNEIICTMTSYILSLTICHVKFLSLNESNIVDVTHLHESPLQLIIHAINRSTNSVVHTESLIDAVDFVLDYLLNPLRSNFVDTSPYAPFHDTFSSVYHRPCIKDERLVNQVMLRVIFCIIYAFRSNLVINYEIPYERKLVVAIGMGKIINIPLLFIMKGQMGMDILALKFSSDPSNEGNSYANSSDSYNTSSLSNTLHRSQSTIQSSNLDETIHEWRGLLNYWLKFQHDVDENVAHRDHIQQIQENLSGLPLTSSHCSHIPLQLECGGILTLNPRSPAMFLFDFDVSIRFILAGLEEIDNNKAHNNAISSLRSATCCKNLLDIFVNLISGWCQAIKSIKYDEASFGNAQYHKFSEDAKILMSSTTLHHVLKLLKGEEYKRGSKSYRSTILCNLLLNNSSQISISKRKYSGLADSVGAKTGSYEYMQSSSVHSTPQRSSTNKFEEILVERHIIVILSTIYSTILAVAEPSPSTTSHKYSSKEALDTFENSILSSWPLHIIENISEMISARDHVGKEVIQAIIDLTVKFCVDLLNLDSKTSNTIKNLETRTEITNFLQQFHSNQKFPTSLNKILTLEKSPSSTLPTTSSPMLAIGNNNATLDINSRKRKPGDDADSAEYAQGDNKLQYNGHMEAVENDTLLDSDKEIDFDYSAATASANIVEINYPMKNSSKDLAVKDNCEELLQFFHKAQENLSSALTYAENINFTKNETDKEKIKTILLDNQLNLISHAGIITNMLKKIQ